MSVRSFRSSRRWALVRHAVGACLFVSLLFGAVAIPEAWAATYFVNVATGNNANTAAQAMSAATPWQTITRAITEPTLAAGDTINVAAGNYNNLETFPLFLVNGVAIVGAGAPATSIFGIFLNTNTPLNSSTRLSGVELQSKGGVGMRFELQNAAMAPRIDNVTFTDTLGAGIQIVESTAADSSFTGIIENNVFDVDSTNISIFQDGGGAGDVYSPTIRNNSFTGIGTGIQLTQEFQAAGVMAPTISGNTFTGGALGVSYSGSTFTGGSVTFAPLISNNTFTDVTTAIQLSASDVSMASNSNVFTFSPTITNNTITGGTGDAISVSLSVLSTGHIVSNLTISGNTITNPGSDGMELSISELFGGNGVDINWTITNNTITGAGSDGISLSVSSLTGGGTPGTFCVTLAGNTITGSGSNGMSISISPGSLAVVAQTLLITGNTITGSGSDGISISLSSQTLVSPNDVRITNNVLSNNGDDGLEIGSYGAPVNPVLISCNTISSNGDDGIDLEDGTSPPPDFGGGNRASPGNNNITGNVDFAFDNFEASPVKAENNFWGLLTAGAIDAEINDDNENVLLGAVDFEPFRTSASTGADCPPSTAGCAGGVVQTPTPTPTGPLPPTSTPTATRTPTVPVGPGEPAVVPTLGGWGLLVLVGLLALAGFLLSRRGGALVIVLLLFLAPAAASAGEGKDKRLGLKVATVQKLEQSNGRAVLRLRDGSTLDVAAGDFKLEDRRFGRDNRIAKHAGKAELRAGKLAAGQAVLLKIKYDHDGTVKKVKAFVYESAAKAKKALDRIQLKRQERRKAVTR